MTKTIPPQLRLESFSCPHCGALAHQYWHCIWAKSIKADKVFVQTYDDLYASQKDLSFDETVTTRLENLLARLNKNDLTYEFFEYGDPVNWKMVNLHASRCHSCDGFALWFLDRIVYPRTETTFRPHEDMPPDVKAEFNEAAGIYDQSPKGAAALLRLAVQLLMPHLGEKGKDVNADIGKLVSKGLSPVVQQSLDVVRVVGNNAVHPGSIDLNDTPETASKLFDLVNIIVQSMISTPKQIAAMFESLPAGAKEAIEKRDKPSS